MEFKGVEPFRVGGTTGGWLFLFKEWAELGERMIPLEVHVCPRCRKIELFLASPGPGAGKP